MAETVGNLCRKMHGGEGFDTLTLDLFSRAPSPAPCSYSKPAKRPRVDGAVTMGKDEDRQNPFDFLSEEILFLILDRLESEPLSKKSFSLVCRSFYTAESCHRRELTPLRSGLLPAALARYPSVEKVDLSLCPTVTDTVLFSVGNCLRSSLRSIDLSRSKGFSHAGIESVVENCANLVEMNLSNATDLSDAAAAAIGRARNLERLWLARCKLVTDMGIGCIAVGCQKLKLLCLKWCLGISDLGVALVAVKCKQLRNLNLSFTLVTGAGLEVVLQLPYLEDLALVGCLCIDDGSLLSLKHECKSLQVLNLSNSQPINHAGLSSLLNITVGLRQLNMAYCCMVTHSLTSSFRKLAKLQSVKLDGCEVTTAGLKTIANACVSLTELSLRKCSGVTDDGLSSIVMKNKGLTNLDITCCGNITDLSLANITSSCTSLITLQMESCTLVSKEGFRLIGQHCHLLEHLDLTDNELDDEGLKAFSGCHKLSILKIGICLKISDEGLIHIAKNCPKLRELDLYRSAGVKDAGIRAIAHGCPQLQITNLAYCTWITDASLRALSKCSDLNTLEIRGCPQVSSAGVIAIAVGCPKLTKLDIKKCYYVNDAAMLILARFSRNLHQINLSYCSITNVGLLALASVGCLQNMTILHLKGLTPNGLAAALLACGGLTKVKLNSSFKPLIPRPLLEHVEERGCVFQWIDKPFQVELESSEIWAKQLEEMRA
ncbi:F-box/LRR-repeat protein 3-like [Zingiber officinale]|uniref:F-box/LRR-repeat protein 3-like n=1 Tax=Zingiber officinale TaxID=94328 RepID=UPI001C4BE0E9|nr:F-box/LRR-repeat protein 3-like [Zingiber officinale]XP_042470774.1 F-box/LRR-repeat protein 3-like [Zingiber officinale]